MGRPKGSKNKHSFQVEEMAQKYNMEPFDFMMAVLNNDWKKLGFDADKKISYTNAGIEFEEPNIKLSDRVKCAEAASKYLYSSKQAVTVETGEKGFKIILEDYTKK